jgi:hypothetical protein
MIATTTHYQSSLSIEAYSQTRGDGRFIEPGMSMPYRSRRCTFGTTVAAAGKDALKQLLDKSLHDRPGRPTTLVTSGKGCGVIREQSLI